MRISLLVLVAAGALSCAQLAPTSRPAPIQDRATTSRPAPPAAPTGAAAVRETPVPPPDSGALTTPLPPPTSIEPTPGSPFPSDAAPGAPPAFPPPGRATRPPPAATSLVALILPLDVPAYSRAADAVRAGFLAAADAAGARARCIVIGHKEDGVLAAFAEASAKGVRVIVGPLLRDDLKTLALADPEIPWTVALNQIEDPAQLPPTVYSFGLAIEADARVLARRAQEDGVRSIDVIAGGSPLMQRFASTFATEWVAGGGSLPSSFRFDPAPDALTQLRRNLARSAPDGVLLAVDGGNAALVKSYTGTVTAYASGLVFERPDPAVIRDLNQLRIVEIPWLVTPDAPEFAKFPRPEFGSAALERLYALGIDAFRVSQAFGADPPAEFSLEGATGTITLGTSRQFMREGRLAVYRDGRLLPLDPR